MAESDQERELRELRERLAKLEGAPPLAPPAKRGFGCGGFAAAGLLIVALLYGLGQCTGGSPGAGEPVSSWTPPSGFVVEPAARGGAIATKWEKPTRAECRGSGVTCFAMDVITERDCPRSLYASITLFNAAGNNIGWTNDTAQGVQAGEQTRLVFDTYERGAETARIAEINCY